VTFQPEIAMLDASMVKEKEFGMALLICEECKGKVSSKADNCPHCGCPVSDINSLELSQYHKPELAKNLNLELHRPFKDFIFKPFYASELNPSMGIPSGTAEIASRSNGLKVTLKNDPQKPRKIHFSQIIALIN
jgi:ribosomal protein L40E